MRRTIVAVVANVNRNVDILWNICGPVGTTLPVPEISGWKRTFAICRLPAICIGGNNNDYWTCHKTVRLAQSLFQDLLLKLPMRCWIASARRDQLDNDPPATVQAIVLDDPYHSQHSLETRAGAKLCMFETIPDPGAVPTPGT